MTTQLKICGIRSLSEIQELKDLPIDYFGCIFAPKSPRYVSVDLAKDIVTEIHCNYTAMKVLKIAAPYTAQATLFGKPFQYTIFYLILLPISLIFNILYSIAKALPKVVTALDLTGKYLKTYRLILIF